MYRVFEVEKDKGKGWEIFWCPSAPRHYADKVPYEGKVYSTRQAAYRRVKQLKEKAGVTQEQKQEEHAA